MYDWIKIRKIATALEYIEGNLQHDLSLGMVAKAAYCSKFHLHRQFSRIAGMTLHGYVQRRRLTEAARSLVFSHTPILHIALAAGFESQQAFTSAFRSMFKKTPNGFRKEANFYPLQLPMKLGAIGTDKRGSVRLTAAPAGSADIPSWMNLARMAIDGFPNLKEEEHLGELERRIAREQALIVRDGDTIAGAAMFSRGAGSIDFLAIHPFYRSGEAARGLFEKVLSALPRRRKEISITTYRDGDKADTGHRRMLKLLGFREAELLTEFDYPTQRMLLNN